MSVANVFHVDPLNLEMALEFAMLIFPPEGECLIEVATSQAGNALEMTAFDSREEHVGIHFALVVVAPVLVELVLVAVSGGPDTILDGLVNIVVVAAADDDTTAFALFEVALLLEALQVWEGADDGSHRLVVGAFHVFVEVSDFAGMVAGAMHLLIRCDIKIMAVTTDCHQNTIAVNDGDIAWRQQLFMTMAILAWIISTSGNEAQQELVLQLSRRKRSSLRSSREVVVEPRELFPSRVCLCSQSLRRSIMAWLETTAVVVPRVAPSARVLERWPAADTR